VPDVAAAIEWQKEHKCFGCHVQAQALMGQALGLRHGHEINRAAMQAFVSMTRLRQEPTGAWEEWPLFATGFATMGLAYASEAVSESAGQPLRRGLDWLVGAQDENGAIDGGYANAPVMHGSFMATANAIVAFRKGHQETGDARYATAATRALAWLATTTPETAQDRNFKVIAMASHGTPDQRRQVRGLVDAIAAEQQRDGGWKEAPDLPGSNAYATGQALYAMKTAGVSIHSLVFRRGVKYLLDTQVHSTAGPDDGAWPAESTQSGQPTRFPPTMWAVIGLAGSFGTSEVGGLEVTMEVQGERPPARALEIVLDASGSMKLPLGNRTRWQVALGALEQAIAQLPEDLEVALRVYGHRHSSRSQETCTDTEVVVPFGTLDRRALIGAARKITPRGETPLVHSLLQAAEDLRERPHASVVLVTDGEESCGGDPETVPQTFKDAGVDAALYLVGFTLESQAFQKQLTAVAERTGGKYFAAADGPALARALALAAGPRFSYEVIDQSGKRIATGETGRIATELVPGEYRLVVKAPGQELTKNVSIANDQVTSVRVVLKGDRFALEP